MDYPDSRRNFVDVLPTMTAGMEDIDANFVRINLNLYFVYYREYSDSRGRGMDSYLSFRIWYPLYPVNPTFKFHPAEYAFALNLKHDFIEPPNFGRV